MRSTLTLAGLLLAVLVPPHVQAEPLDDDPFAQLQRIREAFLEGSYDVVEQMTADLLEDSPSMLVRASALQYLGASLELLGRSEEAEEQFEMLLTLQPEFHMNLADFPTEVISLFESVRLRVQDRLNQIAEQRRRQQDAVRRERERQLLEQQRRLLELARPRYVLRETVRGDLIVALLPFGAGQFQNGQSLRGWVFFGTQVGLAVASMAVWLSGTLAPENVSDRAEAIRLQENLQIASYSIFGALGASVLWGIVDALVNYRRSQRGQERWREVDERSVPVELRLPVDPELLRLPEMLGVGEAARDPLQPAAE